MCGWGVGGGGGGLRLAKKTQAVSQRNYFNVGKGDFNGTSFNTRSNEIGNRRSVGGAAGKGMTNNYVGHVG